MPVPRRSSAFLGGGVARLIAVIAVGLLLVTPAAFAKNGAFKSTLHGNADKGPKRKAESGRGTCSQCHEPHEAHGKSSKRAGLFTENDNNLCFTCHTMTSESGIFSGPSVYARSTHGSDPRVSGGGSDNTGGAEPNRCTNCHDPHGNKDREGVVPAMLHAREPEACIACHDGSRGADIRGEAMRPYVHGQMTRGRHDGREGSNRNAFGNGNRHASCSDCHNVHRAASSRKSPEAPEASSRLAGVSRVQVVNGGAGTVPTYVFQSTDDTATAYEYEICFKCHSSWTAQPVRQPDLALLTNPANPSYHPIQSEGTNLNINPDAFVNGYDARSQVNCTSCHGSDSPRVAGLHGSSHQYLLKAPVVAEMTNATMQRSDLCFGCHSFDVYANRTADEVTQRASRFNRPGSAGHAFHVGEQRLPCFTCHETHGSTRYPFLIAAGKGRGITSFMPSANGGTCTSTCHESKSYTVNYAR